jgi:two-component system nitrogen regulation response regulator GlnG
MPKLLVIDDESSVLYSLGKSLRSETLEVLTASTGTQGIEVVREQRPDAVILDLCLPDMAGLQVFDQVRHIDARLPVIIITAYATTETAIEAMKRGALEYMLKPVDLYQLREIVDKAVELSRLQRVPAIFEGEEASADRFVDRIVGRSPAMQAVYKTIGRVAPLDVPVLIVGESGTGKELVARAIYNHSRRSSGPFLAINCAAIPEGLLESELFGHERGAFTGADRRRIGKFEQAQGGTIFLDEIGDMTPATQPKILRLLQEQQFQRVGGNDTIAPDVRLIAATNRNLEELVATGRLRQDLYYRLKVFTICLPPLRERAGDLSLLVDHLIKVLNPVLRKQVTGIAPEALRLLEAHDWPGNVRELQSVIKYALVQAMGDILTPGALPETVRSGTPPTAVDDLHVAQMVEGFLRAGEPDIYRKVYLEVDRLIINTVLNHVKGNQAQASQLLGISRTTLRAKLGALGMAVVKKLLPQTNEPISRPDARFHVL